MKDVNTITVEAQSFQDMYAELETLRKKHNELILESHQVIKELEEENDALRSENERLNRMKRGLMLNNSRLTQERNDLVEDNFKRIEECNRLFGELQDIKGLSMWEFANKYCNDSELEEAGHQLARSLLGGK